jgi:hypothetical protein
MIHRVAVPGLSARPYFSRHSDDAIDLCDVLSSFASSPKARVKLHELCKVTGLSGKPEGIHAEKGEIKQIGPDPPYQQHPVTTMQPETRRRPPQGDVELMTEKQILGFDVAT